MRNLVSPTKRDNAAIFSVPGAGKTVESLAFSTVVAGGNALSRCLSSEHIFAWENELTASLNIKPNEIIRAVEMTIALRNYWQEKSLKTLLVNYNRLWYRYRVISNYIQRMVENSVKLLQF